jgi:hypothetical protein
MKVAILGTTETTDMNSREALPSAFLWMKKKEGNRAS